MLCIPCRYAKRPLTTQVGQEVVGGLSSQTLNRISPFCKAAETRCQYNFSRSWTRLVQYSALSWPQSAAGIAVRY